MQVMKFGGGCLKRPADVMRIARIVSRNPGPQAVVVSAVHGVTDRLERAVESALGEDGKADPILDGFAEIHHAFARAAAPDRTSESELLRRLDRGIRSVRNLCRRLPQAPDGAAQLVPRILSHGERSSAHLLSAALNGIGRRARAMESEEIGLLTDQNLFNATVQLKRSEEPLRRCLEAVISRGVIPVITGFYGHTEDGKISLLGRNGTDYSAAVIARALGADTLVLWKDVRGFMSADPALVPEARLLRRLTFREAAELSYFGAHVIHPRTLEPLAGRSTSITIRSVHRPRYGGTRIWPAANGDIGLIKSVTYNRDICVLRVRGPGVGYQPGVISRIGRVLVREGINIYSILTAQTCINLLLHARDGDHALRALRVVRGGAVDGVDLRTDLALIAVVGEGILERQGLAAAVFTAVSRAKVNVEMISTGASPVASYFIVRRDDMIGAVQAIHQDLLSGGPCQERTSRESWRIRNAAT